MFLIVWVKQLPKESLYGYLYMTPSNILARVGQMR